MKNGKLRAVVLLGTGLASVGAMQATISSRATAQPKSSETITITRSGAQPASKGSAQYFTGAVRIDPLFDANQPAQASGASVTFEPGARTAWHTHPLGQTLIVTAGLGRIARWGDRTEDIRPGVRS